MNMPVTGRSNLLDDGVDATSPRMYGLGHAMTPANVVENGDSVDFYFLDPPQDGDELGWLAHYRILKLIGQGGMGIVFLAEDPRLHRHVALKVMRPELAEDSTSRQRFLREARATASLRNEHIVTIFEIGQANDVPFLATELLQGMPLDEWLRRGNRASPSEILRMAVQIARGLAAAHKSDLIHRDIKPANIWIEVPGNGIKILDFGLARLSNSNADLTMLGTVLGTLGYMAPEQALGEVVDVRSDLFSFGCVLYEIACGIMPFDGTSAIEAMKATIEKDPTPLHEENPALPSSFCDLITTLLAKDPRHRPASAAIVVETLESIINILDAENQHAAPQEGVTDFATFFARLRQIGAIGFHLERVGAEYRARIDLPITRSQETSIEGRGANERTAIDKALANSEARK
jgi:serine/threonine protein kinase